MKTLEREFLLERLNYDPNTGVFTWKNGHKNKIGLRAGYICKRGYWEIVLDKKKFYMHRLAFIFMNIDMPIIVDHINGVKTDNRWVNLRAANKRINSQNRPSRSNCGYKGVTRKGNSYRACIRNSTGQFHIGSFDNPIDAAKAWDREAKKHYGDFARLNFND